MKRLPSRVAVKAYEQAMVTEHAAAHAFTAGDDHRAYKLWLTARDAYRRLGFDELADRCDTRGQRCYRIISGDDRI